MDIQEVERELKELRKEVEELKKRKYPALSRSLIEFWDNKYDAREWSND